MAFQRHARLSSQTSMNLSTVQPPLSLEEYLALPDDDLYFDDVSRGRLVREPRPGNVHGSVVAEITYLLRAYLEHTSSGRIFTECGFVLNRSPLTIRGPDVAFVRTERLQSTASLFDGAPDIAIEVVAPSNRAGELLQKVGEFLSADTQIVWVVYPETETVVEHRLDGSLRILSSDDVLIAPDLLPGFELRIGRIFE